MEKVLISACLLGFECKYCGGSNKLTERQLAALRERFRLIPVCPETAGGLPTPRDPSERLGDRVVSNQGRDVTAQYQKGAETALWLARRYDCKAALLKEKSPSCGSGQIYDGSFTGKLIPGDGVAAEELKKEGLIVFGESDTELLITVFQE
ncbi:MAG: DUF523 domain-containing protein [Oscillospiraceae bacterium]|nr:DUF523 domain-containing protein [Oscillospiraceae bacterium]